MHFEDLWEEAEQLLQTETSVSSWQELTKEALGKLNVLGQMTDETFVGPSDEEKRQLRANVLGKLLLVMTQLSAKDGINVFAALKSAIENRKISIFEDRYK